MEDWDLYGGSLEGQCQFLGSEYWVEVPWVDTGIVTIPLFKIDIHCIVSVWGLVLSFPGWKQMMKLNPERHLDHHACQLVRISVVGKYCKFW